MTFKKTLQVNKEKQESYLCFNLGIQQYGIPCSKVIQVIEHTPKIDNQKAGPFFVVFLNNKRIVPVIDINFVLDNLHEPEGIHQIVEVVCQREHLYLGIPKPVLKTGSVKTEDGDLNFMDFENEQIKALQLDKVLSPYLFDNDIS